MPRMMGVLSMRRLWRRITAALETAEHIHFIDMLLSLPFDWRTCVLPFLGAAVTFIWAALASRSPLDVWVLALNVLAAFLLISLAVMFGWNLRRIGRQAPTEEIQRMPIIDFVKLAEKAGWRVGGEHNLEAVDLMEFLIQAGCDGTIRWWGRLDNSQRLGDSPLIPIDKAHWQTYEFDWASVLHAKRNMQTKTYKFLPE